MLPKVTRIVSFVLAGLLAAACGGGAADPSKKQPLAPEATAPGLPVGEATTKEVGPEGATLEVGNLTLEVPTGALGKATEIEFQPITNKAWGGIGQGIRITAADLDLAEPVRLSFSYTDALAPGGGTETLSIAYQDEEGFWRAYDEPEVDEGAGRISLLTTHFSDWSLVVGMQLTPMTASVKTGESLLLEVSWCQRIPLEGAEPAVSLLAKCGKGSADDVPYFVSEWAVNGVAGGSGDAGTVSPRDKVSGTFVAPGEEPSQNPVSISARVDGALVKTLLVAEVQVEEEECEPGDPGCTTCTPASTPGTVKGHCALYRNEPLNHCFEFTGPSSHLDAYREACPHRNGAVFSEEPCPPLDGWMLGCCLKRCGEPFEEVHHAALDTSWPESEVAASRQRAEKSCQEEGGTWVACGE